MKISYERSRVELLCIDVMMKEVHYIVVVYTEVVE
jgi:hypothetical protein